MSLLEVTDLHKAFGGLRAVNGVDLTVEAGEKRAVIGPNGAGKTTLFNLVTGHHRPDRGQVRFAGEDITGRSPDRVARAGIGRAFQITSIFSGLTVHENVQLGFIARLRESTRVVGRAAGRHAEGVEAILDDVGLLPVRDERAGNLSHGDQRALELAISVALEPQLLLLDEPTAGMAPEETRRTMQLVRRIAEERQLSVLFCEHDMEVVFGTADRVLVMHQGAPLVDGTPEEVRAHPDVQKVYLGEDE